MIEDLHVHSTISDGSDTFEQVILQAKEHGVGRLAFTNHDTTACLSGAQALGECYGVEVVGGIEISAYDFKNNRKVHVLGLGLKESSPAVNALCQPTLDQRQANSSWQLDRLLEAGWEVDLEMVKAFSSASTALYKQHLMAGLTDAAYGSSAYCRLYTSLFKGEGICCRDIQYVDARDAVTAIVEEGGMAVVAHPGQLDSYDMIPVLVECGLGGIERNHPDHKRADHLQCDHLAERYGLVCTGGSDYHGSFGRAPHVGYGL